MFNNEYKYNIFYWIYDCPLLDNLITFRIPLQSMSFSQVLTQVLLHCALMIYIFLRNLKSFWSYKYMYYMMSFLIIITMITNNFWIFCSSFSIFELWLAKLLKQYLCFNFLFYFTGSRLNWQVYCMGSLLSGYRVK